MLFFSIVYSPPNIFLFNSPIMTGSILLNRANGSLGLHAAEQLLKAHKPRVYLVIARYPAAKASIHKLDLTSLFEVHALPSKGSSALIAEHYPPLRSIICNAAHWNLVADSEKTADGYDMTLQVNHISHVALVLRLLGSFVDEGRIVLLSSIGHYRMLNHPSPDSDKQGRGFQRYPNSKLLITIWMYPLDYYLQQNPKFKNITVVAINPGGLGDSHVFQINTPRSVQLMQTFIMKPFMSVINYLVDPTFRSSAAAGLGAAEFAVGKAHTGERGYFNLLKKDESDPLTMEKDVQQRVWRKSLEWAKITRENTALQEGFDRAYTVGLM
ncbi:hypothetical protein HYALB_00000755 [Hymenoscyphus albidus]|uniref:NAD(P)-binding protein n=1 Tax=Hymenoscyphus albidus TaxID=595503 RepID=A0A9N9LPH0_9HELO|nr:hypothetical protein HYALB_00000755 [Hymenoscyphus albidus]